MSSCKNHLRLNYLSFRKLSFVMLSIGRPEGSLENPSGPESGSTPTRCANQISERTYQLNVELMASESSALLVLLMQHISTQA
jgi:hypothetical protein